MGPKIQPDLVDLDEARGVMRAEGGLSENFSEGFQQCRALRCRCNVETLPLQNVVSAIQIPKRDAKVQREKHFGLPTRGHMA